MDTKYDIEKIREYIKRCNWTWAKSYKSLPHEWILRKDPKERNKLSDDEYMDFVKTCNDCGVPQKFGKMEFHYLYVDGWKYWCCATGSDECGIINRAKVFYEFREIDYPYHKYYSENALKHVISAVMCHFSGDFLDIGVGNGDFIRRVRIDPKHYHGVEPNRKAIEGLRASLPEYRNCITIRSFEEAYDRWSHIEYNILGLFGSASYVMSGYIKMIKKYNYFLMFYKEGFCPEEFKSLHHFNYTKEDVKAMLPDAFIYDSQDYVIASSKPIDWNKEYKLKPQAPIQTNLFE